MPRVLVLATTTGYQTRAFGDAAARLGVELVFATDRCHLIDDPWQDQAVPIRFFDEDASVAAILESAGARPIDGVLVVGDRPTVIAARVAEALGLPFHSPAATAIARHKQRTRECLRDAGLPVPWFLPFALDAGPESGSKPEPRIPNPDRVPSPVAYPCVVKPVALSGSRGVIRANDAQELAGAIDRLRAIVDAPDVRAERNDAHRQALVEGFIRGREYAIDALMHRGEMHLLALFDKPDPLDGPFFEETIYLTPSSVDALTKQRIVDAVRHAVCAIGLAHGPIHAECRVNDDGVFVLEVAARPIGGLCARALRFAPVRTRDSGLGIRIPNPEPRIPLEEVLLRHALGESPRWQREELASGVMMIPIPKRGILRGVDGVDAARAVDGIVDLHITAKTDQLLVPLPEGASYLGFLFARAGRADAVETALRAAHAQLRFAIDPEFPVLPASQIHYNLLHG
jgi:ATP-grasp domain/L-amino acid ligase C-terminal domain 2/ATP-grasp N-terminal domain